MDEARPIEALIALLGGDDSRAVEMLRACGTGAIADAAAREGVVPLAAHKLAHIGEGESELAVALAPAARAAAVRDISRCRSLQQVLEAFAAEGVPVLVFKGEHVAHACYARPDLRPRTDSDLLVRPEDRERAARVLENSGYRRAAQLDADLISYQASYVCSDESNPGSPIDLHWRVTNPQVFGNVLSTDDLFAAAVPLEAPGLAARVPSTVHALAIALVHRIAHHAGHTRLIWDVDVACLARLLSPEDWATVTRLAHTHNLGGVFATELERASRTHPSAIPAGLTSQLRAQSAHNRVHLAREYPTRAGELFASLRAFPTWRNRAALLRQHLLPPREYMRDVYAPASRAPLAVLYVRRAVAGAWKYCRFAAG